MKTTFLYSIQNTKFYLAFCFFFFLATLGHDVLSQNVPYKAPLYWSVYEHHWIKEQAHVEDNFYPENDWKNAIDWVDQNLKPYGYNIVAIDGWGDDSQYNQHGYRSKHSRHWQNDYAYWSNYLKSRGMTLGMYNNPLWVNKAAAAAGVRVKGTNIPLSDIINPNEETMWGFTWVQVDRPGAEQYVKGYIQYYADMGVKYFRVDFLSWYEDGFDKNLGRVGPNRPRAHYETALRWMKEACDANGMFLSLVMPHLKNDAQLENRYGHMIRINEDVWNGTWQRFSELERGVHHSWWSQWYNTFDGYVYWSKLSGRNKLILDGDFIRLNTMANDDEKRSVISLHLMAGGPLSPADQPNTMGNNLRFYQNREMLALNQDGFVGKPLSGDPRNTNSQIWKGQMSNGDWVVGLFNRENNAQTRSINFATELGLSGNASVRDLWSQQDLGSMNSFSASIPAHGCRVLRISNTAQGVAAPTFTPPSGTYASAQSVSLSTSTSGATIHYTTDGSTPTTSSPVYTGAIQVTTSATLRAIAVKSGLTNSPVSSATYTIGQGPGIVSGGIYKITARHSGKSLDVSGVSNNNGAAIHQWDYVGGANQKWKIEDIGSGFYKITATHSNKVLDVSGVSLTDNAQIHQWDWVNGENQKWKFTPVDGGFYRIEAKHSGKALDVFGASNTNGALVKQFTYSGSQNQQWKLELLNTVAVSTNDRVQIQSDELTFEEPALYPNPAEEFVTIDLSSFSSQSVAIQVVDNFGRVQLSTTSIGGDQYRLSLSSLSSGYYIVELTSGVVRKVKKLVIKK